MRDRLFLASRVLLGGLFIYASLTKIPDMGAFAENVSNYRIVPPALVSLAASTVIGVELVAGVALVLNLWAKAAAAVLGALLLVFTLGLSSALLRGIDLACGCFGGNDVATWWTVFRDVLMFGLAAVAFRTAPPEMNAPG